MKKAPLDTSELSRLLESAKAEAERHGAKTRQIAGLVAEALSQVRNLAAHGGHPDEGLRPDQLTSDNDR